VGDAAAGTGDTQTSGPPASTHDDQWAISKRDPRVVFYDARSAGSTVKVPPCSGTTVRKARSSKVTIRVVE